MLFRIRETDTYEEINKSDFTTDLAYYKKIKSIKERKGFSQKTTKKNDIIDSFFNIKNKK
jgi:hypothetical protein